MVTEDVAFEAPDRYGQKHPIETPQLIARKLAEFDEKVAKLVSANGGKMLLQAQQRCPELLTEEFKLIFLRADVFNAPLAAIRYAKYWEVRVKLFGPDKAFQPLTVETLDSDDDRIARESGLFNIFQGSNGRIIAFEQLHKYSLQDTTRESYLRVIFYLAHFALENPQTQKKGMIVLNYPAKVNLSKQHDPKFLRLAGSLKGAIPLRLSAYHVVHPPKWVKYLWPLVTMLLGKRLEKRVLLHTGTPEHLLRQLQLYELGKHDVPVEIGGTRVIDMSKFYQERQAAGL